MTSITVKEAKAKLAEFIRQAERSYEEFIITRNGKPTAALISFDELESIKETLDLQSNRGLVRELRAARKRARRKKGRSWQEIKKELGI